jgi:phosphoadenosine phosphosulfate reductase
MNAVQRQARLTAGFDDRLAHTLAVLQDAASRHAGSIVQATSLGAEDMVVTDLIARHGLGIELATLDTGKLHQETLDLLPRITDRYGLSVERYSPSAEQALHFVERNGEDAMFRSVASRKACCALRKLEPLGRMLEGRSAWVTGLRREQSGERGEVAFVESDGPGREKINPLADWRWADVWHYIERFDVPYNPLHDDFFPSIGCAPCTRAVAMGEDFRAGRWWWEQEGAKECGLHLHGAAETTTGQETLA